MKVETDHSKMLALGATGRLIVQQALARGLDVN